jgi:hypothetical protein
VLALFGRFISLGVPVWRAAMNGDVGKRVEEVRTGKREGDGDEIVVSVTEGGGKTDD